MKVCERRTVQLYVKLNELIIVYQQKQCHVKCLLERYQNAIEPIRCRLEDELAAHTTYVEILRQSLAKLSV